MDDNTEKNNLNYNSFNDCIEFKSRGCEKIIKDENNQNRCCNQKFGWAKLHSFDWLNKIHSTVGESISSIVEVRFKNSRKEFYKNENNLKLEIGDIVVVSTSPGYDIGFVSLIGKLAQHQLKIKEKELKEDSLPIIYRKARLNDIEKWEDALSKEVEMLYKARIIASNHKLDMKISDVEFQGDKTKAIFYYTAEGRVDFRILIKDYAETFKIRIEMRQIGARQEAGRLGGIGSCGRELCCSSCHTDFKSVSTVSVKDQQLALNPLKLAGQCGKLKCCLNYELASYIDALKEFPETNTKLVTKKGVANFIKLDVYKRILWYSYEFKPELFIELSLDSVLEIIKMNKNNQYPEDFISEKEDDLIEKAPDYENVVGQDSLTRFDKKKKKKKKKKNIPQQNNIQN